jgi:hypothetical protein
MDVWSILLHNSYSCGLSRICALFIKDAMRFSVLIKRIKKVVDGYFFVFEMCSDQNQDQTSKISKAARQTTRTLHCMRFRLTTRLTNIGSRCKNAE